MQDAADQACSSSADLPRSRDSPNPRENCCVLSSDPPAQHLTRWEVPRHGQVLTDPVRAARRANLGLDYAQCPSPVNSGSVPAAQHSMAPVRCPVQDTSHFGPQFPFCSARQKGHQQTEMSADRKMARSSSAKCSGFVTSCYYETEKCRCCLILEWDFGWENGTKQREKLSLPVLCM